ncbi:MAG: NAD-dependent protein deacylase [Firmicutes bacterium]|nr:NAD-dependent protein deacylase [Bacillota bacterium]
MQAREQLREWLLESKKAVFFGGAGVSTESGIPDFRSENGIYRTVSKYGVRPEEILSHTYFVYYPERFYEYYRENLIYPDAEPNAAHKGLAYWEKTGHLRAVVTQNIDGLHQKAGSQNVYELHGSTLRNYCLKCKRKYGLEIITETQGVPVCPHCGGQIRPDVVLYEEGLDEKVLSGSVKAIEHADLLIVGGTSLAVYPAAGLIRYFRGSHLVLINRDATPYDREADLVIHENIGEVFADISHD